MFSLVDTGSVWRLYASVVSGLLKKGSVTYCRPFTESDDTRGCNNTISPPEDKQSIARNMLRIIM